MSACIDGYERHWSAALPAMTLMAGSAPLKREGYFARSGAHVQQMTPPPRMTGHLAIRMGRRTTAGAFGKSALKARRPDCQRSECERKPLALE